MAGWQAGWQGTNVIELPQTMFVRGYKQRLTFLRADKRVHGSSAHEDARDMRQCNAI